MFCNPQIQKRKNGGGANSPSWGADPKIFGFAKTRFVDGTFQKTKLCFKKLWGGALRHPKQTQKLESTLCHNSNVRWKTEMVYDKTGDKIVQHVAQHTEVLRTLYHSYKYTKNTLLALCHDIVCLFALWIRNCIAHSKPIMMSHALGGLAGSRQTLLHESNEQISRLKNLTSYKKSDSVNRCTFAWRTIPPFFIPIRFETMEPYVF